MKVLFITSSLFDAGGAERVITTMANYWADKGWQVKIATLDDGGKAPFYNLSSSIEHKSLGIMFQSPNIIASINNNFKRTRLIKHCILKSKPDVIISFLAKTNVRSLLANLGTNIPIIVSERNHPYYFKPDFLTRHLRKLLYLKANYIVCQTSQILDCFISNRAKNGAVIANPVIKPSNTVSEPEIYLPEGKVLLAAGSMSKAKTYQKGFDLLIPVFSRLATKFDDWSLVILGDGSERHDLQQEVRENNLENRIILPGNVKDITSVFSFGDLFVLSSRFEGFPNVLGEAMACGLPVVSFDGHTGAGEIIREGVDGLLIPNQDITALENALGELFSNEAKRHKMGMKAKEVVFRFSLEKVMKQWEDLINASIK